MMEEKVLDKKIIPLVEVKELLRERAKEGELSYEQGLTLKHAEKFSHLTKAKAEKLLQELKKIEGVNDEIAIKLVDILPDTKELLLLMLPKGSKLPVEKHDEIIKLIKKDYDRSQVVKIKKKKKK
ncbi:MAG: RNA polymerase Rpb4 family protein [archaeon]